MAVLPNAFPRGSEWRQWDFHVHTPASFHWNGPRFSGDSAADRILVDQMITTMNDATPAVFVLMDYWSFDGWFALQKRLQDTDAPQLHKKVFPGIELRLNAPAKCRVNAHVLFSDEIEPQALHDFRSALTVEIIERPLSDASLIELARRVGTDKLKVHSFNKSDVDGDDAVALQAGSTIAEIKADSYQIAIKKVPKGHAIGFMPFDTSDGLAEVKWHEHYAFFLNLFTSSPIFETRNADLRSAFVGEETAGNTKWFNNFQYGLNNVSRLAVAGSDAHRFSDYGKYPSGKATWIKADPTFLGLLQAIKEPANRSFIGDKPPKLREVEENRTYFIDSIQVHKAKGSTLDAEWLAGITVSLNSDLVAIIGNKGSGKSALADVIALLGNSKQVGHFSFLKKERFRGKSGDPAKQFVGRMTWLDKSEESRNLSENPPGDKVQLVRYIPQGHFEDLCNDHVSGHSGAFERELRGVIFDHASDSIRLGALDFDQLIEQQEKGFRDQLSEYRKDLAKLNQEIQNIEIQRQPQVKSTLQEQLSLKKKQIDEHNSLKPIALDKPSDDLSQEQQQAAAQLDTIAIQLKALEEKATQSVANEASLAVRTKAVQSIRERIRLLERQYKQLQEDTSKDFLTLGLTLDEVVTFFVNSAPLDTITQQLLNEQKALSDGVKVDATAKHTLLASQASSNVKLNEPQLRYQQNLAAISAWQETLNVLTGSPEAPETLLGIETRIAQLDELPAHLEAIFGRRVTLCGEIFDTLDAQRKAREDLFKPVQDLIQGNSLIRDEYKLQFQATLGGSAEMIASELFSIIKQNVGDFRGEDESFGVVRQLSEQYDLSKRDDTLNFSAALDAKIHATAAGGNADVVGITTLLRKDRTASDVYDLLYGLKYLEPRYSLLFQDAQIEQLSPGQRGALLLIFYLLVDKGRNPIVLDQPEENLDNETVVSLLVPVLTEAKKKRQLIMVTHNPNLAVVCDAEQVIYSAFDRKNGARITYVGGSIENHTINKHVVNVLEGTKRAFNNRKDKYH